MKISNVYSVVADGIYDFSVHKINRTELYDLICNCFKNVSDEDIKYIDKDDDKIDPNLYIISKKWLNKK
jgi:hypothetical protein